MGKVVTGPAVGTVTKLEESPVHGYTLTVTGEAETPEKIVMRGPKGNAGFKRVHTKKVRLRTDTGGRVPGFESVYVPDPPIV